MPQKPSESTMPEPLTSRTHNYISQSSWQSGHRTSRPRVQSSKLGFQERIPESQETLAKPFSTQFSPTRIPSTRKILYRSREPRHKEELDKVLEKTDQTRTKKRSLNRATASEQDSTSHSYVRSWQPGHRTTRTTSSKAPNSVSKSKFQNERNSTETALYKNSIPRFRRGFITEKDSFLVTTTS